MRVLALGVRDRCVACWQIGAAPRSRPPKSPFTGPDGLNDLIDAGDPSQTAACITSAACRGGCGRWRRRKDETCELLLGGDPGGHPGSGPGPVGLHGGGVAGRTDLRVHRRSVVGRLDLREADPVHGRRPDHRSGAETRRRDHRPQGRLRHPAAGGGSYPLDPASGGPAERLLPRRSPI